MISILHTWGQNMSLHPHIHCIIPGGGLTNLGIWKTAKSNGKYLFPVKAMSKVFRAKFVAMLRKHIGKQDIELPNEREVYKKLFQKKWVVYAKRPFGSPKTVLEYLGRYSHKIAISNHRIIGMKDGNVTFFYKDYRQDGVKKKMTLTERAFIRRFALHILPSGFMRIRHYGILSSGHKKRYLRAARKSLSVQGKTLPQVPCSKLTWQEIAKNRLNFNVKKCSYCGKLTMKRVGGIAAQKIEWCSTKQRAPPVELMASSRPKNLDKVEF